MAVNKLKELSPTDSVKELKKLVKVYKKKNLKRNIIPGNLIFTFYNAKFKEFTYDRNPLFLVLAKSPSHTLGLNFHWIPYRMRINLIKHIIKVNEKNIKAGKSIEFNYLDLKPMLKRLGYAPCIRLYINTRLSTSGVVLPPSKLLAAARLRAESFTNGKYSAEYLYKRARSKAKNVKNKF